MSDLILLGILGPHQPDTTGYVISTLVEHGLEITELSQSVVSGYVTMAISVRQAEGPSDNAALETLQKKLAQEGCQCCYQRVTGSEPFSEPSTGRSVLTLMSKAMNTVYLKRVFSTLSDDNWTVNNINTLSRPPLPGTKLENGYVCHEIIVTGDLGKSDQLKQKLLPLSDQLGIDIVLQNNVANQKNYKLVVFDMDSTLIKAEVIDLLADAAGVGGQVAEITEQAMRGELDFNESFKHRLAMLKGLDESVLENIARQLPIMDGAETLIKKLKAAGYKTAIISGGFIYFADYLKNKLNIDYVYANELDIVDRKMTGQVKGPIINGERKAQILEQIAFHEGISTDQVIAVGDGANDLPMLGTAGLGIAFRAKPVVREQAQHAISVMGLDGILYLLGFREDDLI